MTEENQNLDFITKITNWYAKNEKMLTYAVIGVLVLVGGIYAYNYYSNLKNNEAQEELYGIQAAFAKDSFDAVLKGTNEGMSAIDIADEYGNTKAGNLAKFYAGVAFFKKSDFETAMDYLKSFDANGDPLMAPNRLGMIGDCYASLKDYEEAASYFNKAGKAGINDLTTPHWMYKAGAAYEKLEDFAAAAEAYQFVIDNCPEVVSKLQTKKFLNYAKARAGELVAE